MNHNDVARFTADPKLLQKQLDEGSLMGVSKMYGVSYHTIKKFIRKNGLEYTPKSMNTPRKTPKPRKRVPVFKVFPPLPPGEMPDEAYDVVLHMGVRKTLFQVWIVNPKFVYQLSYLLRSDSKLCKSVKVFLNWINDAPAV